jgi:3-phosphoshikimate 1-carboxyvinyltransferase
MATLIIQPGASLHGETSIPGDKSISHRALMLGGIAQGTSQIKGWLPAGDTTATLNCMRALGVDIKQHSETSLTITGGVLRQPSAPLDMVNAGTGIRLLAGILVGQPFESVLDGSEQLRRRPMKRITDPLRQMGADISDDDGRAPLTIRPAQLHGITFEQQVASAQVKSCVLLAGLFADGPTVVIESGPGRDHTERMLRAMGADISVNGGTITLQAGAHLKACDFTVPGDFSSAAFLLAAGIIVPESNITLTGVNTNETRTGLLDVLSAMGASVILDREREEGGEPVADLIVQAQPISGTEVGGEDVVRMIDEFPVLMVTATQASGSTRVRDAAELRVKETDRIAIMAGELRKMGGQIEEHVDGFALDGGQSLHGATVDSHDDHRIGMSLAIAALVAEGETRIEDAGCIHDSFPGFEDVLKKLGANLLWQN